MGRRAAAWDGAHRARGTRREAAPGTQAKREKMTGWRIIKRKHDAHAFEGEGARLYGGRWNSPGRAVVYAAESIALAALELLVHVRETSVLYAYSVHAVHFADRHVMTVKPRSLPATWRHSPAPHALASIGDAWLRDGTSVVLRVPSAVIPMETNYLINPLHPDFSSLTTEGPLDFDFDPRLLSTARAPRHQRS